MEILSTSTVVLRVLMPSTLSQQVTGTMYIMSGFWCILLGKDEFYEYSYRTVQYGIHGIHTPLGFRYLISLRVTRFSLGFLRAHKPYNDPNGTSDHTVSTTEQTYNTKHNNHQHDDALFTNHLDYRLYSPPPMA